MKIRTQIRLPGVCLAFLMGVFAQSAGAAAGEAAMGFSKSVGLSVTPLPVATADAHTPFDLATRVAPALLEEQRGGADTVYNDIQTSGVVGNNQAWNLNTGANTITDGAFVGANGLSTVVQNSGNNVLIQNSTIINIQLK